MTTTKVNRFNYLLIFLVLYILAQTITYSGNVPIKTPAGDSSQSRLATFLSDPNHSADVLYLNSENTPFLVKGVHQMPPSPKLIERLKKEGKWDTFVAQQQVIATRQAKSARPLNVSYRMKQNAGKLMSTISTVTGTQKALVLCVDFSNNTARATVSNFSTLLFGTGSSLRLFYQLNSGGRLDVGGVVGGWYRAPQIYSYYVGTDNGTGTYPNNAQKLVEDTLALADPYVNFADYDSNHDGRMDILFVVHAGLGAEYTGSSNDIWSHQWSITAQTRDGVIIEDYSCEPEYWETPGDMTIGVYCHELGHVFGLPDLYDRIGNSEGDGKWSIMASGSWNGTNGNGNSPSYFDAWCRTYLGWTQVSTITSNIIGATIPAVENTPLVYKLWANGTASNEYFLVENRQPVAFDVALPGYGLLIYHVDTNLFDYNYWNNNPWYPGYTTNGHYFIAVEQADGLYGLETGVNRGDAGDPWPGSSTNRNFNISSIPNSRAYSGQDSLVSILNISNSNSTMTADLKISTQGPPVCDFAATPLSGYTPLTVQFTDQSLYTPNNWYWEFGDGQTLWTQPNPIHVYTTYGLYTVKLTVSNTYGISSIVKQNLIRVYSAPPDIAVMPASLNQTLVQGSMTYCMLTIWNTRIDPNSMDLSWNIDLADSTTESSLLSNPKSSTTISLANATPGENQNIQTTDVTNQYKSTTNTSNPETILEGTGSLLKVFNTGLSYPWGVGRDTYKLWVSNYDNYNDYQFNLDGTTTGRFINTLSWYSISGWAADMCFDGQYLWQVRVSISSPDNSAVGIYCINPNTGAVVKHINGPWSASSAQRGIAFDPGTQSFYVSGWIDKTIYNIDTTGALIQSKYVGLSISGLAWHPFRRTLWAITNSTPDMIYELNPVTFATITSFNAPLLTGGTTTNYAGAGMEIFNGHLFAVNQVNKTIVEIDTGYPAPELLSVSPFRGTTPFNLYSPVTVTFDARASSYGTKTAYIRINSNVPGKNLITVPVTVQVLPGQPQIGVNPSSLSFASTFVGATVFLNLQISNALYGTLSVTNITGSGDFTPVYSGPFSLGFSEAKNIPIQFIPTANGLRSGSITIYSNSMATTTWIIPVSGIGYIPPVIQVTPSSFPLITLPPNTTAYSIMSVQNIGASDLIWQIISSTTTTMPTNYTWLSSDQTGGPTYNWIDISGTGTKVTWVDADDGNSGPFPIGFNFNFYGSSFSTFRLCTNGWMSFTDTSTYYANYSLPNSSAPANLIAPFWDDLDLSNTGNVYYQNFSDKLVVSYVNAPLYYDDSPMNFQIILKPGGTIIYQYQTLSGRVTSATVGIQDGTKTKGLTVAYNTTLIHNNMSIQINPAAVDWINVSPNTGTTSSGSLSKVTVTFNTSGMTLGTSTSGYLLITSNDPIHSYLAMPVQLSISTTPPTAIHPLNVTHVIAMPSYGELSFIGIIQHGVITQGH